MNNSWTLRLLVFSTEKANRQTARQIVIVHRSVGTSQTARQIALRSVGTSLPVNQVGKERL